MKYSDEFEQLWLLRPSRIGNNPKPRAYKAYNARLKAGYTHTDMIEGLKRYKAFCEVSGTIGTQFVMHMSTFLSADENFLEDWTPPEPERKAESVEDKGRRLGITPRVGESMEAYTRRIQQAR